MSDLTDKELRAVYAADDADHDVLVEYVVRLTDEVLRHRKHAAGDGIELTAEQLQGMDMWDRDVMLDERHRAAGSYLIRLAVAEIRRGRLMVGRMEEWATQLEDPRQTTSGVATSSVGHFIAAELRNRMNGVR